MAASRARLEALLARVQKRANEPRTPSAAVAPILEAVKGGASRSSADASAEAPVSVRATATRPGMAAPSLAAQQSFAQQNLAQHSAAQHSAAQHSVPQNEVGDEDIEEYDDELIEIIDDAEVIPQAAAVARAIEPAAFGAAVDRRPAAPIRSEPMARPGSAKPASEALRPETIAARPIAATEVARARSQRRELRHTPFVELLDASLKLG
jgi:hypothetical protein